LTSLSNEKSIVHSVKNAMRILRLFTPKQSELGITEIAEQLRLSKSSVHRYVQTLAREGFLVRNDKTGEYRLGLSLLTLGGIAQTYKEIYADAVPYLQRLAERFRMPAHLCIMENRHVFYLLREMGGSSIKLVTKSGRYNDLHCTAEGLVILAFKSADTIGSILNKPMTSYTAFTVTDPEQLERQLSQIRSDRYAITRDTYAVGYTSIAVPIQDDRGEVVSSLALIGETRQVDAEREGILLDELRQNAKEIAKLLGYYES